MHSLYKQTRNQARVYLVLFLLLALGTAVEVHAGQSAYIMGGLTLLSFLRCLILVLQAKAMLLDFEEED